MNYIVGLNLLSSLVLFATILLLVRYYKIFNSSLWVVSPLFLSVLFYLFIAISNILEHSLLSSLLDPFEDISEIFFLIFFIFFINNSRAFKSLEDAKKKIEWFHSSLESVSEGLLSVDNNGKIQYLNGEMKKILDGDDNLIGSEVTDEIKLYSKETKTEICRKDIREILERGSGSSYPEGVFIKSKKGKFHLVTVASSSIINDSTAPESLISFHNIGDYISILEQLNQTRKMEALGQLAGGVAHDLNNMLAGIMGAADLLIERFKKQNIDGNDDMLNLILESSENAKELINNLLAFGRKGKIISTPLDIDDIINKSVLLARRTIDKLIKIDYVSERKDLSVIGDPSQLQNLFLNLFINAKDSIGKKGTIEVRTDFIAHEEAENENNEMAFPLCDYIRIAVSDDGKGIPDDLLGKIFEPFFTTKAEGKGTGLGLAAVYGTVKNHHGFINVKNGEKGCCFTIYLPAAEEKKDTLPKEFREDTLIHNDVTVLVIEDENLVRATAKMMIKQIGYHCLEAENGAVGLEILNKNLEDIDLVLLDMVMPEIGGLEVLEKIKSINPDLPVILTSGFTHTEKVLSGASGFIKKPYRLNELINSINDCLGK